MSAKANANLQEIAQGETYAVGNLNQQIGAAATSSAPADASGYLQVLNNQTYKVSGRDVNGNRRVLITFCVLGSSPAGLQVTDTNGCQFMTIQTGQIIALSCDADLWISGNGGTCKVTVGQVFLKNSK
jgi:hypothetical protein